MGKFTPKDFIAITALVGVLIYKMLGHNGGFDALVTLIIGYYFGRRDEPVIEMPEGMIRRKDDNVPFRY